MSEIKDGIYGHVSGTVGRTGSYTKGSYAVLEVKREGSQYPDRVTVWGLDAAEGDRVSVKGWLSWKKTERDGKTYFDVSLNKPSVEKHEPLRAAVIPTAADGADDWSQPSFTDETPF